MITLDEDHLEVIFLAGQAAKQDPWVSLDDLVNGKTFAVNRGIQLAQAAKSLPGDFLLWEGRYFRLNPNRFQALVNFVRKMGVA
jgi:hypothetical protein